MPNSVPDKVFSFVRQNEIDKVFAVLNFSAQLQTVTFEEALFLGGYTDFFRQEPVVFQSSTSLRLDPWDYRVFVK